MNREMDMAEVSDGKLYGLACLLYRDGNLRGSRSF